ncbi:hypothetical protein CJ030_MR6G020110 [Morella rubra]|uniref:Pentacotripeptide-repeat region of PRORP domain-containing protein n=1 Tax=Morella rubra TaxID=262757 RepID=A0A6A1VCQ9_9ROSI|nr:hypothetical protein CJ030_MR6G020110 [Morella rubra]
MNSSRTDMSRKPKGVRGEEFASLGFNSSMSSIFGLLICVPNLVKVGLEGFNLLEEYYNARTRRPGGKLVYRSHCVLASLTELEGLKLAFSSSIFLLVGVGKGCGLQLKNLSLGWNCSSDIYWPSWSLALLELVNSIRSITFRFPLIWPLFAVISNFIGKYQLLATQASPDNDEVTDEVLSRILATIENAPRPSREISTAVSKLCQTGNLSAAAKLLQSLCNKHISVNPKAYNLLLGAASERHDIALLSQVFKDLLVSRQSLSSTSYLNFAKAFTKTNDVVQLHIFVKEVSALTSPSATVVNRLISAFAECGQVDKALLIYDLIKNLKCEPDLITYNTILDILGRVGRTDEMLHQFACMKEAGIVPDVISYNTLLNNLRRVGRLDLCLAYFREMSENGIEPDLLTYTALIEIFGRSIGKH